MKKLTKDVFYCDFCKKHGLSKHKMITHEQRCTNNPVNDRKCFHCRNLDMEDYSICDDYGNDTNRVLKIFFCKEREDYLHPPLTEYKGNFLGDTSAMIKINEECDCFVEII